MSIKAFRKPPQTSPELTQLATAVDDYTRPLTQNPVLDSRIIQRIKVSTTKIDIAHSLGRPWVGWWVVRNDGAVVVYEAPVQADRNKYISLVGNGLSTVDLYIF